MLWPDPWWGTSLCSPDSGDVPGVSPRQTSASSHFSEIAMGNIKNRWRQNLPNPSDRRLYDGITFNPNLKPPIKYCYVWNSHQLKISFRMAACGSITRWHPAVPPVFLPPPSLVTSVPWCPPHLGLPGRGVVLAPLSRHPDCLSSWLPSVPAKWRSVHLVSSLEK